MSRGTPMYDDLPKYKWWEVILESTLALSAMASATYGISKLIEWFPSLWA